MGQFSWFTQDDHSQIVDEKEETVYMVDPRDGTVYEEKCYQGYGVFGGRDYYELLADINKNIILGRNVKHYKDFNKELLKLIITGNRLEKFMFLYKNMTLDEIKLKCMDMDYRGTHQCNSDGSWPIQKLEDFDKWYNDLIDKEIKDQIEEDEKYTKLYNKSFKHLTKDDIDDKRGDGIELWFHYVEPDSLAKYAEPLDNYAKIICPILVRNPNKWKLYKNKHPKSDPNQGWEYSEEDE